MRSIFSALVVVALAELFVLAWLRLKYGNTSSGNYQPRAPILPVPKPDAIAPECAEESDLRLDVDHLLYAFELVAPHVKKIGNQKTRITEQEDLALSLIEWAICHTDHCTALLRALTKPAEIEQ